VKEITPRTEATPKQASGARRTAIWIALVSLVGGLMLSALFVLGSGARSNTDIAPCAAREVEVGLSSPERSTAMQKFAVDLIKAVGLSAAVCGQTGEAYGVAGGGQVFPLLSQDDVAVIAPQGPNRAVRLARLDPAAGPKLAALVAGRLHAAYQADGDPTVSSVAALYAVAAEHAGRMTDLVLLSAGVNHDTQIDLNRPLDPGDGERLARNLSVATVHNRATTLVGIAQVDASRPVPGPSWPTEVRSFNQQLCQRSRPERCRIFSIASVTEALQP
jgi:hypothetical protein